MHKIKNAWNPVKRAGDEIAHWPGKAVDQFKTESDAISTRNSQEVPQQNAPNQAQAQAQVPQQQAPQYNNAPLPSTQQSWAPPPQQQPMQNAPQNVPQNAAPQPAQTSASQQQAQQDLEKQRGLKQEDQIKRYDLGRAQTGQPRPSLADVSPKTQPADANSASSSNYEDSGNEGGQQNIPEPLFQPTGGQNYTGSMANQQQPSIAGGQQGFTGSVAPQQPGNMGQQTYQQPGNTGGQANYMGSVTPQQASSIGGQQNYGSLANQQQPSMIGVGQQNFQPSLSQQQPTQPQNAQTGNTGTKQSDGDKSEGIDKAMKKSYGRRKSDFLGFLRRSKAKDQKYTEEDMKRVLEAERKKQAGSGSQGSIGTAAMGSTAPPPQPSIAAGQPSFAGGQPSFAGGQPSVQPSVSAQPAAQSLGPPPGQQSMAGGQPSMQPAAQSLGPPPGQSSMAGQQSMAGQPSMTGQPSTQPSMGQRNSMSNRPRPTMADAPAFCGSIIDSRGGSISAGGSASNRSSTQGIPSNSSTSMPNSQSSANSQPPANNLPQAAMPTDTGPQSKPSNVGPFSSSINMQGKPVTDWRPNSGSVTGPTLEDMGAQRGRIPTGAFNVT